jgi:tetratricopeptide (TPR) repeat protein
MYNIDVLEDEWKRYNRKKKRPWIIGGILFSIFLAALVVLSREEIPFKKIIGKNTDKVTHTQVTTSQKTVYLDAPLHELERKKVSIADDLPMETEISDVKRDSSLRSSSDNRKEKKIYIEVVKANNKSAYKEVEKRFRLGHDIDDSLFLAKAYYLKGQYKKAEYWALQTNKINENIEESWLIFIKSKYKRGQENEAIRILNTYIKKTDSSEAKVLLEKIKKRSL